jgi:hypothetical protein
VPVPAVLLKSWCNGWWSELTGVIAVQALPVCVFKELCCRVEKRGTVSGDWHPSLHVCPVTSFGARRPWFYPCWQSLALNLSSDNLANALRPNFLFCEMRKTISSYSCSQNWCPINLSIIHSINSSWKYLLVRSRTPDLEELLVRGLIAQVT